MDKPTRKQNRLNHFDYSSTGAYFITICTSCRHNYFWNNNTTDAVVGATIGRPANVDLSPYGIIADKAVNDIPSFYPGVTVEHYVIMPDHIHLLILIRADKNGRPMVAPTVSRIVQQFKGSVTKKIGRSIWQKSFYDHVIRDREDYARHIKYIYENPAALYYD